MAVIFIFVDGVGLGKKSSENPFFAKHYESIQILSGNDFFENSTPISTPTHVFKSIDANLNIEDLPQSGTGQTTLFSGVNASKVIGKHFGLYPHSGIRYLLEKQSLFHAVKEVNKSAYFVNAYPLTFFELAEKRNRWSCSTLMVQSAGYSLNSTKEVINEEALTAEIVQDAWRKRLHIDIPKITTIDAGKRVLNLVPNYDLLMYKYYLTDKAGHNKSHEDAERVMKPLDELLLYLLKNKRSEDLLVITSDHGNMEDLSIRTHTKNKVPFMVFGHGADAFSSIESLVDVKEIIINRLM